MLDNENEFNYFEDDNNNDSGNADQGQNDDSQGTDKITVSKEEWEQIKTQRQADQERLAKHDRFYQDLSKAFNPGQEKKNLTKEEELNWFVNDAPGYRQAIKQEVAKELLPQVEARFAETERNNIVNEYKAKFPEYAKHEDAISGIFGNYWNAQIAQGKTPDFRQTLDASVKRFNSDYGNILGLNNQNSAAQRLANQLDIGTGNGQKPRKLTAQDIDSMSSEEFRKFKARVMSGQYKI